MRYSIAALALAGAMASSPVALGQQGADADAAALFREAEARYVRGDVAGALEAMERSYTLSGRAELLFNLGELRRELGRCAEARRDYEAYLERVTAGARRESASQALEVLQNECPDAANVTTPEPAPSPAPAVTPAIVAQPASVVAQPNAAAPVADSDRSVRPLTVAGWSAIGAGVLAGVGATIFAIQAANDESRLESRIKDLQRSASGDGFYAADKELEADGKRSAMWARVLGIGAAGFAGVGVSLLVFGRDRDDTKPSAVSLEWRGDGAAAAYRRSF